VRAEIGAVQRAGLGDFSRRAAHAVPSLGSSKARIGWKRKPC
jgi:hypothetical protein